MYVIYLCIFFDDLIVYIELMDHRYGMEKVFVHGHQSGNVVCMCVNLFSKNKEI